MENQDIELLSGTGLSREQRVVQLSSSDIFVISEPGLNLSDAEFYQSKHVTYGTFCQGVYQDLSVGLGLCSMAFQDEKSYSESTHDHFPSYVKAEYVPNYVRDYELSEDDDCVIVLGHIVINGRSYDMCVPKIDQSDVKIPEKPIGMLKFLAVPRLTGIDEDADDFDGWTYPDGRLVSKARFPSAYAEFGPSQSDTDDMFAIPVLSDFIQLNPYAQADDPYRLMSPTVGMAQHVHQITDIDVDGSVEFDLAVKGYNTWKQKQGDVPEYKYHHGTMKDDSNKYVSPDIIFSPSNIKINTGGTTECDEVGGENYPAYNWLPVMIYIGRPVK